MGKTDPKRAKARGKTGKHAPSGHSGSPWLVPALAGLTGLVVVLVAVTLYWPQPPESSAVQELRPLPERGDPALLEGVERYPSEGREHVAPGSPLSYGTMPPTSGPHYATATPAGFYAQTPPLGSLVHSLEHGAVIVYYVPERLAQDKDAEEHLRALALRHRNPWAGVIVAPHPAPGSDPEHPYVLTAWTVMLRLPEYDPARVEAFLAEYLGRGPENPVR